MAGFNHDNCIATAYFIYHAKEEITMNQHRLASLVAALFALSLSVTAQEKKVAEKDVPKAVLAAFKSTYPNATVRGYSREKENGKVYYEIESMEGRNWARRSL